MSTILLQHVWDAIDQANREDPRQDLVGGKPYPKEWLYSERMTEWVKQLAPQASEELLIAARAQHICRWKIPRANYPWTRKGYIQWRETLKRFHADLVMKLMKDADYPDESIQKVENMILYKNMSKHPEGQTLEDAACLVFLQYEFEKFSKKADEEKIINILRRTWGKMSEAAHQAALQLAYAPEQKSLIEKALTSSAV